LAPESSGDFLRRSLGLDAPRDGMSFLVESQDDLPFLLAPKYSLAGLAWRLVIYVLLGIFKERMQSTGRTTLGEFFSQLVTTVKGTCRINMGEEN
jgi:hypothetical protein